MSTSAYEYRVLTDLTSYGLADDPLDAFSTRVVMSNLNHMSDEFAQVRCCIGTTLAAYSAKTGYQVSETPVAVSTPYSIVSATFPMNLRADGSSYKLRIRIGGCSANAAATAIFYAALSSPLEASTAATGTTDATYVTAGTTGVTAAWLTGASQGTGAFTTMMRMNADQAARCRVIRPSVVALGSNPASVTMTLATLTIFASTTNISYTPRLFAVHAAEVIGLGA